MDQNAQWGVILNCFLNDDNNSNSYMRGVTGVYPKLKSFWSCSPINCYQHFMLHINLDILNIHLIKCNLSLKDFQESINYLKSY